jgi:hypothetical protein
MPPTVISVENLSKVYRLGQIGGRALAEALNRCWHRFRGKPDPYLEIGQKDRGNRDGKLIWALHGGCPVSSAASAPASAWRPSWRLSPVDSVLCGNDPWSSVCLSREGGVEQRW